MGVTFTGGAASDACHAVDPSDANKAVTKLPLAKRTVPRCSSIVGMDQESRMRLGRGVCHTTEPLSASIAIARVCVPTLAITKSRGLGTVVAAIPAGPTNAIDSPSEVCESVNRGSAKGATLALR